MRNQNLSDADLTTYSSEHLLYEFQLLYFAARELGRLDKPQAKASVLIESFGIHLRNLIDFFCIPTGKEREDDVIASDFCPGWSEKISAILEDARERANKELNHLTLKRKAASDPKKPWDVNGLYKEIIAIAQRFVSQADSKKLSVEIPKWLTMVKLPTFSVAVGGGLITSNSTTTMSIVTSAGGVSGSAKSSP